jgi:hypothetical protein
VARITEVHKDTVQPLAHVRAAPFAHIDTDSEVMLIWFRHDSPAAPLSERNGALISGDRNMQPLPVPVKPTPPPPAETTPKAAPAKLVAAKHTGTAVTKTAKPAAAKKSERPPT